MSMKASTNEIVIEGTLYEKVSRELEGGAIAGELIIEVPVTVGSKDFTSLIPVSFYAAPITKAGKPNVAHKGIQTILDKGVSLSEADGDYTKADKIRVRNAQLGENMFFAQDDRFVSFPRIRGNFFDRVKATDVLPRANFKVKMIVAAIAEEEVLDDGEMVGTGRLIVTGHVVQYNGEIDEIKFIVEQKKYVDFVEKKWSVGDTVAASGVIKYSTVETIEKDVEEEGFGEPIISTVTRKVHEFIITNGSDGAVSDGYEEDEIIAARRSRKLRITELKEKQDAKEATKNKGHQSAKDW